MVLLCGLAISLSLSLLSQAMKTLNLLCNPFGLALIPSKIPLLGQHGMEAVRVSLRNLQNNLIIRR